MGTQKALIYSHFFLINNIETAIKYASWGAAQFINNNFRAPQDTRHIKKNMAAQFKPRISSRRLPHGSTVSPSLEDLYPLLPAEELRQAMAIETAP